MNFWLCVVLGIVLAIAYKGYKSYKQKKLEKQLKDKLDNMQQGNVVVEENKDNK